MTEPPDRDRPIRVTHVVTGMDGGGLETLISVLIRHFAAGSTIRSSIVSLDGRQGRIGSEIAPLTERFVAQKPVSRISMVAPLGLAKVFREIGTDVVHIHSGAWYKGALAARLGGVRRVIYTEHGREHHDPPLQQLVDRWASRVTHRVVAVSQRLADYLARQVGVSRRRIVTIESGVDRTVFRPDGGDPAGLRARLDIPAQATVVGSVGRLEAVKRYDRLLRAFGQLRGDEDPRHPLVLVLCGDGTERPALERLAGELGLADRVRFPGWAGNPADFYRILDVFAMTSESEGLSVSLLEALASGAVPVVNDVGANAEVLGPSLAAQVVPNNEWGRFVEVLQRTVAAPDERRRLRAEGIHRIEERYDVQRMIGAYWALYCASASVPVGTPEAPPID